MKLIDIIGTACLLGAFVVYPACGFYWVFAQRRKRAARLLTRAPITGEQWFRRFFPQASWTKPLLEELLIGLGEELRVPWTCLRPEDTFSSFLFEPKAEKHDELEAFWCAEREWLKRWKIDPPDGAEGRPETISEYIALANQLLLKHVAPPSPCAPAVDT